MTAETVRALLACAALASAAGAGLVLGRRVLAWRRRARHRAAIQVPDGMPTALPRRGGALEDRLLSWAVEVGQRLRSPLSRPLAPRSLRERPWVEDRARAAVLDGRLSDGGFWEARVRLTLGGTVCGGALGALVTSELGACLALAGAVAGWRALPWAVAQRSRRRAQSMERDLSEMLDVIALGMRSGMSFDRSLELYTGHFDTLLAESFRSAHRQWACGLASREEALRAVAASYASPLLGRVVENIVRSLRFGATLSDNLEDAAREARGDYRARRQEQVAKAPVKMMVPTGVLILPAMLMLVLGPVLLELAGGL